jgi:hypothetical protein
VRVRAQLDWLIEQEEGNPRKRRPLTKLVSDVLREYAARELRARGVQE